MNTVTSPILLDYTAWKTPRWKTAINRPKLSTPMHIALVQLLKRDSQVLDFGCGHNQDVERLNRIDQIEANGFDPYYFPDDSVLRPTEVVTLIYVINTIEDAGERMEVLRYCWDLTLRAMVVAVRINSIGEEVTTRWGTFQKYYQVEQFAIDLSQLFPSVSICFPKQGIAFLFK